ncbi:MAG: cupin domain-containing protein [Halothiobacillaceae bacterium]|nr:cupin domain-containing protein [Halothiobacillaceae bacterium]
MHPPILNIDALDYTDWGDGEYFAARLGRIASRLGARKLGYRLVILAPGKTGWPYHAHHVNEEMFFILAGRGTLRLAGERHPVRAGDVIAIPPGPDTPHQLINTSTEELRYLAVSTMEAPEVLEYPDSGKYGVMVGSAPGGDASQRRFEVFARREAAVDYWDGERPEEG